MLFAVRVNERTRAREKEREGERQQKEKPPKTVPEENYSRRAAALVECEVEGSSTQMRVYFVTFFGFARKMHKSVLLLLRTVHFPLIK
jgi:hypothetical protein